jgi:amino acid permease
MGRLSVLATQVSSWTIRRRIIVITLAWCGVLVTYLSVWGRDIQLSETSVNGLLLLMASVIGSYVFGATWDHNNMRRSEVDALAVSAGLPPNPQGGPTVVQQNNPPAPSGPAMPPPPGEQ